MKKFILPIVAVMAVAIAGCNESEKLAKDLNGTWQGVPETLGNKVLTESSVTETFTFVHQEGTPGGTIQINSEIAQQRAASADASLEAPFTVTVSATSTISGSWEAVDDDEIRISLNPESFLLRVDPEAVALTANPFSQYPVANVDSMKQSMIEFLTADLTGQMKAHYQMYNQIDEADLKDKGTRLKLEAGKLEFLLKKVQ